jgi:hypothetical protein
MVVRAVVVVESQRLLVVYLSTGALEAQVGYLQLLGVLNPEALVGRPITGT